MGGFSIVAAVWSEIYFIFILKVENHYVFGVCTNPILYGTKTYDTHSETL